jgi:hypothetical protein
MLQEVPNVLRERQRLDRLDAYLQELQGQGKARRRSVDARNQALKHDERFAMTITSTADLDIVITRVLNAPRELVFDAWTGRACCGVVGAHWIYDYDGVDECSCGRSMAFRDAWSRLERMHQVLSGYVVSHDDDVHVETLGTMSVGHPAPMKGETIFRIASLAKPIYRGVAAGKPQIVAC